MNVFGAQATIQTAIAVILKYGVINWRRSTSVKKVSID